MEEELHNFIHFILYTVKEECNSFSPPHPWAKDVTQECPQVHVLTMDLFWLFLDPVTILS